MLTNDLFNTDYERRLNEGAVDQLEQRRIDDLNMKMDELANRVKTTADKAHRESLLKAFLKCKEERDSYYKIKETAGGIGQDLVTPQQRVQQSTPQKQTPVQKVGSTVKHAANWLAGKGGPGKEGPTYEGDEPALRRAPGQPAMPWPGPFKPYIENGRITGIMGPDGKKHLMSKSHVVGPIDNMIYLFQDPRWKAQLEKVKTQKQPTELDEQNSPVNGAKLVWSQIAKAVQDNVDFATVRWPDGQQQKFTRNQLWHIDQKVRAMSRQARNQFALKYLASLDNLMYYLGNLKTGIKPRPQLKPQVDPDQQTLDLPKPTLESQKKNSEEVKEHYFIYEGWFKPRKTLRAPENFGYFGDEWIARGREMERQQQAQRDQQSQAQAGTWTGPAHGSSTQELALFKAGNKPVSIQPFVDPAFKQWKELIDSGKYPTAVLYGRGKPTSVVIGQPNKADDVQKVHKLVQTATEFGERGDFGPYQNPKYHTLLGKLLGYSQSQIDSFLRHYFKDKTNEEQKDSLSTPKDTAAAWALKKAMQKYPSAGDPLAAFAMSTEKNLEKDDQSIQRIRSANSRQDELLQALVDLDKDQSDELEKLDSENDNLERKVQQLDVVNKKLQTAVDTIAGRRASAPAQKSKKTASSPVSTVAEPNIPPAEKPAKVKAKAEPQSATQAVPKPAVKPTSKPTSKKSTKKKSQVNKTDDEDDFDILDLDAEMAKQDAEDQATAAIKKASGNSKEKRPEFDLAEGQMDKIDIARQDLELMSERQFYVAYGMSKAAFQQQYRTLLKPAEPGYTNESVDDDDWDEDEGDFVNDPTVHAQVRKQPLPDSVLRAIERDPGMRADIIAAYKRKQGIAEGPDLINMSDLQFYKELLAVLVIPIAGLGAAAWHRAQNALKLYRAEDVINALNKKGITVDRATLGQIKPLLLKLEQAIDVDRDGDAAKELAQRIQQTVAWGKLKQAPVQPATPVVGRNEPGVTEEQKPAGWGEFPPKQEIKIDPPKKLKSGQTYQDQNKYWQSQGQAPIYKTNEAGSPAQQAAIAISMKKAGKKPKQVDEDGEFDDGPYTFFTELLMKGRPLNMERARVAKYVKNEVMQQQTGQWAALVNNEGKVIWRYNPNGYLPERFKGGTDIKPVHNVEVDAIQPGSARMTRALGPDRGSNRGTYFNQDTAQDWHDWADEKEARKKPGVRQQPEKYMGKVDTVGPRLGEEKTRLDPKCWTGKKIGNPKTKMKGGVRVNNCVPAEESYTGVMESQGITDPKLLEVARRIDAFAKTIK